MNPAVMVTGGLHAVFLIMGLFMTAMTWRLWRRGHLSKRLPFFLSAFQTGLCTLTPASLILYGRVHPGVSSGVIIAVFAITVWMLWRERHAIAILLIHQPPPGEPGWLWVMRGLPGCGKSTMAKLWTAGDLVGFGTPKTEDEGRARINRDDLRLMMHGGWKGKFTEVQVTTAGHAAILALLRSGVNVICDDTNLEERHVQALADVAMAARAPIHVIDLRPVPLEQCLAQNTQREAVVPADAIIQMHRDHVMLATIPSPKWKTTVLTSGNYGLRR